MRSFLFILAVILLIGWGIGIFFYALKGLFNIIIVSCRASPKRR